MTVRLLTYTTLTQTPYTPMRHTMSWACLTTLSHNYVTQELGPQDRLVSQTRKWNKEFIKFILCIYFRIHLLEYRNMWYRHRTCCLISWLRTCCLPTYVCSLQCHTEAHPWHIHGSSYTIGLAKAKGAAVYLVDESAVEEWSNSPNRLRDMMMMI